MCADVHYDVQISIILSRVACGMKSTRVVLISVFPTCLAGAPIKKWQPTAACLDFLSDLRNRRPNRLRISYRRFLRFHLLHTRLPGHHLFVRVGEIWFLASIPLFTPHHHLCWGRPQGTLNSRHDGVAYDCHMPAQYRSKFVLKKDRTGKGPQICLSSSIVARS
jgi:hypothetical protein